MIAVLESGVLTDVFEVFWVRMIEKPSIRKEMDTP